jgi:hypothetical protein
MVVGIVTAVASCAPRDAELPRPVGTFVLVHVGGDSVPAVTYQTSNRWYVMADTLTISETECVERIATGITWGAAPPENPPSVEHFVKSCQVSTAGGRLTFLDLHDWSPAPATLASDSILTIELRVQQQPAQWVFHRR